MLEEDTLDCKHQTPSCSHAEEGPYPLALARRRRNIGHEISSPESWRGVGLEPGTTPNHDHQRKGAHHISQTTADLGEPERVSKATGSNYIGQSSRLQLFSPSTTLPRRRLQQGHGVQHVDIAQSAGFWAFAWEVGRGVNRGPQPHLQGGRTVPQGVAAAGPSQPT